MNSLVDITISIVVYIAFGDLFDLISSFKYTKHTIGYV